MFETTVTLVGRLITQLKQVRFDDGSLLVTGRMICTARRYDRASTQWIDGKKLFVTVVCRKGLAENAFTSLRSGDPVMVHGPLYTREYEKDGVQKSVTEVEAWAIGPDLQTCTAVLTKKSRPASGEVGDPPQAADASGQSFWDSAGHPDAELDDRADPDAMPSDDPWAVPVPAEARTAEAAVGV
jgi:single-strand DNA-binding protein